ncbi:MAG: NAD(P)-binding domain-containing protein [Cyanobacteria bacterium P01_F01_bin.150]
MNNNATKRHCIIGAGFSGLTTARKLKELGESFDILDANSGIGGLWHTGAYDSAHLVSSKQDTQFKDFPMPESYPSFPGKKQMQRYLQQYAEHFGMAEHVQLNTYVNRVRPADDYDTTREWFVEVEGEPTPRCYATVAIANGHLSGMSAPRKPTYPGEFTGEIRYATAYRNANDFAGKRILVVGAGNTGCDIAVDSSRIADYTAISMRSGKHFIPKTFLGIPLSDLEGDGTLGDWFDRLALRTINWLSFGRYERYGLPKPTHRILDKHPTINSQLLYQLQHGEITVRREIKQYDGNRVEFVDGTREAFDIIMFAVGYDVSFPMLKPYDQILVWEDRLPILFMGMMAPNYRGLFFAGLGQAQSGGGPLFQGGGDILGRMMAKEIRSDIGVMTLIRNHPESSQAGRNLIEKLDMTSLKGHVVRTSICNLLILLDKIECPDAPR